MNILLTGAAGFIGSYVFDILNKDENVTLFTADDHSEKPYHFEFHEEDAATYLDRLLAAGTTIDCVVHLAGCASIPKVEKHPLYGLDKNVNLTAKIADICTRLQIPLVYASSSSVYHPSTIYGLTKQHAEQWVTRLATTRKSSVTCFRIFTVYGKDQRQGFLFSSWESQREAGNPCLIYGDRNQLARDMVYVEDVAKVFACAGTSPLRGVHHLDLGTGETHTLGKIAEVYQSLRPDAVFEEVGRRGDEPLTTEVKKARLQSYLPLSDFTPLGEGLRKSLR